MKTQLVINPTCCDGCIGCVRSCPTGALEIESANASGDITWDVGRCILCHRCVRACPQDAIAFSDSDVTFGHRSARHAVIRLSALSCTMCGKGFSFFSPEHASEAEEVENDRLNLCPRCRQRASMQAQIAKKGELAQ